MDQNVWSLIASLTKLGGEAAAANHSRFAADLLALLALPPRRVGDRTAYLAALRHGFAYYYWRWDPRAAALHLPVQEAICRWAPLLRDEALLDLVCELAEFHYFLAWCFDGSSTSQCARALPAMAAAAAGFAQAGRAAPALPAPGPLHVMWLAMYATPDDPMSGALRHVAPALLARRDRFRLTVVAWSFADPGLLDELRALGASCVAPGQEAPAARIRAVEALAAADPPAIAISDMNNAVPTALFARRLAPAQVFMQAGMPPWPVRPLDAVLNSFGFDPAAAGWGQARMLEFNPPWDLAVLNPPERPDELAAQRAALPQGVKLFGCYGRLVKLTEPCLRAAERILEQCPDAAFVTGGTGDAGAIRRFIAASPMGARMHVVEGFVPGHSWGRLLDVFLDTWPVTGGESSREMLAKHRPVVTLHSAEMPAIDRQRDPELVARDWDGYVARAVTLLRDPAAHAAACARAAALAGRMADRTAFATSLQAALAELYAAAAARPPEPRPNRLLAGLRRMLAPA